MWSSVASNPMEFPKGSNGSDPGGISHMGFDRVVFIPEDSHPVPKDPEDPPAQGCMELVLREAGRSNVHSQEWNHGKTRKECIPHLDIDLWE